MKTVIDSRENIIKYAADMICGFVKNKPDAVIGFAAGKTQREIYALLTQSGTDFSKVKAFAVCEYAGLAPSDPRSCAYMLNNELFAKLGISDVNFPDSEAPEAYDRKIADSGGLDLVVLGIGLNGHIGFNEPGTAYDTYTRSQQLTDSTKRMKAEAFGGFENVPDTAVTMGLKTICSARNVMLTALGEEKAEIVHSLVYGKTLTYVPAAMLQMHMNMTLLLDREAASKLD